MQTLSVYLTFDKLPLFFAVIAIFINLKLSSFIVLYCIVLYFMLYIDQH